MAGHGVQVGKGRRGVNRPRRIFQQRLQGAVDNEVRVAADGTGEVTIIGLGQAVVAERFGGVGGPFEAFKQAEFDDVFLRAAEGIVEQFLDMRPVG